MTSEAPQNVAALPQTEARKFRDDLTCYCHRQRSEMCWEHGHVYEPPDQELGHVRCEPHGHDPRPGRHPAVMP